MKHIPNILSIFRIILIPFFVWQMMIGNTINAGILLVISGLTDLLDGFLARQFGWISQLGKVLDPVADKLTQVTVCIILSFKLHKYWFFFVILLLKDLIMLVCGSYLVKKGIQLEGAKWFGKISTTLFYIAMILIVLFPSMPVWLINVLLTLTVVCAITSAAMYIPEFRRYRSEQINSESNSSAM